MFRIAYFLIVLYNVDQGEKWSEVELCAYRLGSLPKGLGQTLVEAPQALSALLEGAS
jgi:hypothetical protein